MNIRITDEGQLIVKRWLIEHGQPAEPSNLAAWFEDAEMQLYNEANECAVLEIRGFWTSSGRPEELHLDASLFEIEHTSDE